MGSSVTYSPDMASEFDAAVVLGARVQVEYDQYGNPHYFPSTYWQADDNGMLAGEFRVDGASALHYGQAFNLHPDMPSVADQRFIFTGGITVPINLHPGHEDEPVPSEAATYYKTFNMHRLALNEGLSARGVSTPPEPEIILEEESLTTIQGLAAVIEIAREQRLETLLIVTNYYHIHRARAMAAKVLAEASGNNLPTMTVMPAESFAACWGAYQITEQLKALGSHGTEQRRIFQQRMAAETKGLCALVEDMYQDPAWHAIYEQMTHWEKINTVVEWGHRPTLVPVT